MLYDAALVTLFQLILFKASPAEAAAPAGAAGTGITAAGVAEACAEITLSPETLFAVTT